MGVQELASAIKNSVDDRIKKEARARRGQVSSDSVQIGSRAYPYSQAVDCDTSSGRYVWTQLTANGRAVIVGN